ncbi:MAG: cyclic nucleotide-binding domain-containing protein, partial [Proteobacteria bacterium]|nr:cyclic nucleotide-binding domain-containing protein [Pseudomonadota bacterium]
MAFIDQFNEEHKRLFFSAAESASLPGGQYVIRRGEPGGDVYLLESGTLEVVDSRGMPEVILAVLQAGTVVGEMAFVNDSPRSADVRTVGDCKVMRWVRDDLRLLLNRNPSFAARFFESVAKLASDRIR